jgi:hypothetical protein
MAIRNNNKKNFIIIYYNNSEVGMYLIFTNILIYKPNYILCSTTKFKRIFVLAMIHT